MRQRNKDKGWTPTITAKPEGRLNGRCGVVVACLLHTQEVPGSIPGRGSYLRQVSLH